MEERDRAKKNSIKNPKLLNSYKSLRNKVTNSIRFSRRLHYQSLINENKNNPKNMWKTINKVLDKGLNSTTIMQVKDGNKTVSDSKQIANALNSHFVNVGPRLASRIDNKPGDDPLYHLDTCIEETIFQFKQVNENTVMKYIQNLKQGKSAGPDNIPTVILKDAADCICKPLTMIFNSSFRLGTFPDRWKIARITPIYKSGAKDDTNNYRPISILSVLSKLYEKIAHDQLIDFLQSNKKLTKNQFAFRKLHSTITSLIGVSDHWYSNIDNKKANFALFLDLKKAFDTVDHEILISKLAKYGVKGRENNWLKSYLTNRSQYCSIDGQVSDIMEIESGIPQGSCLGPLLFIIYLNDFEHCLEHSRANMYADDTEITISSNNQAELIETAQAELLNIAEWMRINKLSLNSTKTEYMIIDHPRRRKKGESLPQLFINREIIKQVHKTKYLGVIVDDTLGWEEQYESVKKKVAGGLVAMKKLKDILPQSMLFQVYKALVESHFRYADVVWGSLSNTKITALQRLQNRAFEIIQASKIKDSWIRPTFSIDQIFQFDRSVQMFKIINKICPESLHGKFAERSSTSKYNTRNKTDLQIPRLNLDYSRKSFHYTGLKTWNAIPTQLRESNTLTQFKNGLKNHFLS